MIETFTSAFGVTFSAVMQILLIALAAAVLTRKNVLSDDHINAMSAITVRVLLPCMIFSSIMESFNPHEFKIWLLIPIGSLMMIAFGLLAGAALFFKELPQKKNMLAAASLQNAGYLVLPLGKILYPEQFDLFTMYLSLFLLGISPAIWTLGKYLVSADNQEKLTIGQLFSPPFFANMLGVIMVLTHTRCIVPPIVMHPIHLLGSATVPIATFVLGAILAKVSFNFKPHLFDAGRVIFVKLILTPIATIAVLYLLNIQNNYPLLAKFFVLQAAAAPATALIIQVRHYGGNEKQLSSIVLLCYLSCIITIPFWIAVWEMIAC